MPDYDRRLDRRTLTVMGQPYLPEEKEIAKRDARHWTEEHRRRFGLKTPYRVLDRSHHPNWEPR